MVAGLANVCVCRRPLGSVGCPGSAGELQRDMALSDGNQRSEHSSPVAKKLWLAILSLQSRC